MNSSKGTIEINYDRSSPALQTEANRAQNVFNLMVGELTNHLGFSPLKSPGLSPIFGPDDLNYEDNYKMNSANFKFPKPVGAMNNKRIGQAINIPSKNMQYSQYPSGEYQFENQNDSYDSNWTTSTKFESSLEVSTRSETSQTVNVLDRTMSVTVLLKDIGLGKYSEKFAEAGINLEKFLAIKPIDLQNLGFQIEDCNAILNLIQTFNSI